MGTRDPKVDAYINKAADFAKPILAHFRETVHAACPDVVEEMKWSFPHFTCKGRLCSIAAFKEHAAVGFWKASLVLGDEAKSRDGMGHLGRITTLADLPPGKTLTAYIKTRRKQGPGARGLKAGGSGLEAGPGSFASGTGGTTPLMNLRLAIR